MKRLFKVAVIQAALIAATANANITDGKYGSDQVYDIYHTGCTVAGGACGLYNFDTPYQGSWMSGVQVTWAAGDYASFVLVSGTNYKLIQYSSAGVQKAVIQTSGTISALGDGILYIGTTGFTSTWYYISNNQGVTNASQYTSANMFTITTTAVNPNTTQLQNYSATTAPLVAGQLAPPTIVSTSAGTPIVSTSTAAGAATVTTTTTTRTVNGTDSNGNPTVTTYTDVITNTQNNNTVTTTTTPTTVTTYSDGSTTTTNGVATTSTSTVANGSPTSATNSAVVSVAVTENVVTTSTTYGAPTVTTSVTTGAPTVVTVETYTRDRQPKTLVIDKSVVTSTVTATSTVTTTVTPGTTTTTSTPTTTTKDANGNVISVTHGAATVTTTDATTTVPVTTTSTTSTSTSPTSTVYSTRIDQMDKLAEANSRMNQSLSSDPMSRVLVKDDRISNRSLDDRDINAYIHGSAINTNTNDGYSQRSTVDTYGVEHRVNRSMLVGLQYNRASTTMDGTNGGGSLVKDAYTIYGIYVNDDYIYKVDLGKSNNVYSSYHTLPELSLSNFSKTNGQDNWLHVRVYAPAMNGFRPFVGSRKEHNTRDYVSENGSFLSAVDYARVSKTDGTSEFGVRYEHLFNKNWAVAGEVSQNDKDLYSIYGTLMYNAENNSIMILKLGQQRQNGVVADLAQLQIALRF